MEAQLNITKSIWIDEQQLGTVQVLRHHGKKVQYRLPANIENSVTLRFKGHGKIRNNQTGDLMLAVKIDRGSNRFADLWLSESEASAGCDKMLGYRKGPWGKPKQVRISVPILSTDGSVVRLRRGGEKSRFCWGMPLFNRPRGDLIIKLRVFPANVTAYYRDVHALSTENLFLEGWVFRKRDHIMKTLHSSRLPQSAPGCSFIADKFNSGGWRYVAGALADHLSIRHLPLKFDAVDDLPYPGQYQKRITVRSNGLKSVQAHVIKIKSEFINDPFVVAAIMAHEFCHIIEDQYLACRAAKFMTETGKDLVELERTVDLLVFLHQLGEFQLRVARNYKRSFGYFNQEIFERMYVILQRKI